MKKRLFAWLGLVLGGAILFAASGSTCVANALRDASSQLNNAANDMDPQGRSVGDILTDLGNAFK